MQMPIACFWWEFRHRCKMACVLFQSLSVSLFHFSAAQVRQFYLCFRPCLPTYTDFLSCFPYFYKSSSATFSLCWMRTSRQKQSHAGSSGPFLHTSSFPFPLWCHFLRSCSHAFGCRQTQAQKWLSLSLDILLLCWLDYCTAFILGGSSSQWGESKFRAVCPCFCRCCRCLKGFHCTGKIAHFALITSLLVQQMRHLRYLSGYWVSEARMLCPLLRRQKI